jgi:hypothetical protein
MRVDVTLKNSVDATAWSSRSQNHRASSPSQHALLPMLVLPIPFHSIPSHPIPSHPIPSHSIPFHSIPSHSITPLVVLVNQQFILAVLAPTHTDHHDGSEPSIVAAETRPEQAATEEQGWVGRCWAVAHHSIYAEQRGGCMSTCGEVVCYKPRHTWGVLPATSSCMCLQVLPAVAMQASCSARSDARLAL